MRQVERVVHTNSVLYNPEEALAIQMFVEVVVV
jgi:hypothetical protein